MRILLWSWNNQQQMQFLLRKILTKSVAFKCILLYKIMIIYMSQCMVVQTYIQAIATRISMGTRSGIAGTVCCFMQTDHQQKVSPSSPCSKVCPVCPGHACVCKGNGRSEKNEFVSFWQLFVKSTHQCFKNYNNGVLWYNLALTAHMQQCMVYLHSRKANFELLLLMLHDIFLNLPSNLPLKCCQGSQCWYYSFVGQVIFLSCFFLVPHYCP